MPQTTSCTLARKWLERGIGKTFVFLTIVLTGGECMVNVTATAEKKCVWYAVHCSLVTIRKHKHKLHHRNLCLSNRHNYHKQIQEAQPPLRNRASAMHFFVAKSLSIIVMTYTYICHMQNLHPMIWLICYAHSK